MEPAIKHSGLGKCLTAAKARVTAGFMCAPEMWPTAYIITVTMRPPAIDAPSFETLCSLLALSAADPQLQTLTGYYEEESLQILERWRGNKTT
ncbi:unnamed protein product [Camellia sinensis]